MFSFFKKIKKAFFFIFGFKKRSKKVIKNETLLDNAKLILDKLSILKKPKEEQKSDILKEVCLFILHEFGFGKYVNFALTFAKLLR